MSPAPPVLVTSIGEDSILVRRSRTLVALSSVLLLVAATYAFAYVSFKYRLFPAGLIEDFLMSARAPGPPPGAPPGRWNKVRSTAPGTEAPDDEEQAKLFGLPYAAGSRPAGDRRGVTLIDERRAAGGVSLLVSGHAARAFLIDRHGDVLHTWEHEADAVWPDGAVGGRRAAPYWRRVQLMEGGDLIAIHEGAGLVRLDAASNLLWSYTAECHHDLDVDPDGNILVIVRRSENVSRINPNEQILVDYIVTLSPQGEVQGEIPVLEAFERSEFSRLLDGMDPAGDIFHTNTIVFLDGTEASEQAPMLRRGNLLVSLRHLDIVAVIDPEQGKVVWAMTGLWRKQHDPVLLDDGHMLVFDNFAGPGRSRVIELDPLTQEIVWQYGGSDSQPFFSETCGTNQRLPNGNTLITESDQGRAFEVTPQGEIVWEFVSPYRAGEDDELVATLFELTRLPEGFPLDFLEPGTESR